jgi:toxin ParE1/3/4
MRVRYTPRAREDIVSILTYIERHSPQGAKNVARAMHKTIEIIGQFPQSGRPADESGTRVLPVGRYPYLVYWTAETDDAWIVHIRHTARRPWNPDEEVS